MTNAEINWLRSDEYDELRDTFIMPDGRHIPVRVFHWGEPKADLVTELMHRLGAAKHPLDINWHCIAMMRANMERLIRVRLTEQ